MYRIHQFFGVLLGLLFIQALGAQALAQAVTRGPYLCLGTPTSIIIRWQTDVPSTASVRYGTDLANLSERVVDSTRTTDHEIKLSGLQPYTDYFYQIGTLGFTHHSPDSNHYFRTSPQADHSDPIRVWAIGDFGTGRQGQLDVRDAYLRDKAQAHTDLFLLLGDNAYGDGTDDEYQNNYFLPYADILRNTVAWPSPGNHDYGSVPLLSENGPYYEHFSFPTQGEAGGVPSNTKLYYSFNYGPIHFLALNSETIEQFLISSGQMPSWIRRDLAANDRPWVVAFFHQPPYSKGSHDSDDPFQLSNMARLRSVVNPILEEFGVDLVLSGHSHDYERSRFLNGHYGNSGGWNPNEHVVQPGLGNPQVDAAYTKDSARAPGTVYVVSGCGGQLSTNSGSMDHPAHIVGQDTIRGNFVFDVTPTELHARFISIQDEVLDEFVIRKTQGPTNVTPNVQGFQPIALYPYPNPADGDALKISFTLPKAMETQLRLFDLTGKLLFNIDREPVLRQAGEHTVDVVANSAPWAKEMSPGIYLINLHAGGVDHFERVIRR